MHRWTFNIGGSAEYCSATMHITDVRTTFERSECFFKVCVPSGCVSYGDGVRMMLGRFRGDFLVYTEGLHHGQAPYSGLPARIPA